MDGIVVGVNSGASGLKAVIDDGLNSGAFRILDMEGVVVGIVVEDVTVCWDDGMNSGAVILMADDNGGFPGFCYCHCCEFGYGYEYGYELDIDIGWL